jgi:glycosyltransferase involved in cell wall biosynthesis
LTPGSDPSFQRLRVLHVLEATLGGTLRYMRDIIRVLPCESFEVALAYSSLRADPGLGPALEEARAKGWRLFPVEMVRAVSPAKDLRSARELREVIRNFRPRIMHCNSSKAGAVGRIAAFGLSAKPRVIYSPHAIAANLGLQYLIAERLLAPLTDRFGAVSDSERDEIVKHGLARISKVDVIYPCVDSNFYVPQDRTAARVALGLPNDARVLIGVGRLTEQKDPLMFVEIAGRVAAATKGLKAIWLGDGHMRAEVEAAVRRAGLEQVVELPGWQPDMRPWFAAADLLLSTSKYESFGYMVAEALAMERPAVASAIPGTSDVMSGDLESCLYPPGDAAAAAERVLGLMRDSMKAGEVGRMGRLRVAENFSSARMAAALAQCYRNCVGDLVSQ